MPKWRLIAGWLLTGLLGLFFIAGAIFKLLRTEMVVKQFAEIGLKDQAILIGTGELTSAALFLIPKTHPLGVLLLSGYMGGAIVTHMSHGESYVGPSIFLLLIWVAGFLRRPWLLIDPPASSGVAR
ncbi:MAG: hypothetical protein JWN86_1005 [Planctomycetota bacterium]|nr:hypothetical protein [Planctomycetota bacterium]